MKNSVRRDIVVIGGSAGSLEPLVRLLELLPDGFPSALFVTLHIPADYPSILPHILSKSGKFEARHPAKLEPTQRGVIYVAPPDSHLLVQRKQVMLGFGAKENRHRPAIDVLFRSAARAYGQRVAAVVLSGQLDDGSAGLMAVKMKRGLTIVQDPEEATASEMPSRAIQYAEPDHVLPIREIASLLVSVGSEQLPLPEAPEVEVLQQNKTVEQNLENPSGEQLKGRPSAFACPECHGVLWEMEEGRMLRFRCRVGHAYTADALRLALSEAGEDALWAARRTLEEKAALLRRLAAKSRTTRSAADYLEEASAFDQHAHSIAKILEESQTIIKSKEEEEQDTPDAA